MKVILAYKNFAASRNISHIGLGVAAINTQKSLARAGIAAQVTPIINTAELHALLKADPAITHVNVSAPWIPSAQMQVLTNSYPHVMFSMTCHSNVGFLQADSNGVRLFREAMEIEQGSHNFHVSGNCTRFTEWVKAAYGRPCTYLPNLYYLDETTDAYRAQWRGGPLRIGVFGATRPLKNLMSAAGAALEIARASRGDLEFYLSSGRTEGGGDTVLRAVQELLRGVPYAKVVHNGWQSWPQFRETVGHMHLLLQPSYTESFNMVTADGVAQGVPSVVSHAIDWCPQHWKAYVDDVLDIARVGRHLLHDHRAPLDGLRALNHYNHVGLAAWRAYLGA